MKLEDIRATRGVRIAFNEITGELRRLGPVFADDIVLIAENPSSAQDTVQLLFDEKAVSESWSHVSIGEAYRLVMAKAHPDIAVLPAKSALPAFRDPCPNHPTLFVMP